MKLVKVKIKNFRCFKDETVIELEDLTAFIGRNDAGKSSILEALEIFFNNEIVKIDKDDLNKAALAEDDHKIEISCVFTHLPTALVLDTTQTTNLTDEYLVDANGNLEIKKIFNCGLATPKEAVYINAHYPTIAHGRDLHLLKNQQLKTRASELTVDPDSYNLTANASIRSAIWRHLGNLQQAATLVPIDKEDSKKIWDSLQKWMPVYALFQSDRKSKEDDKEITDPMKVAIMEALREVEQDLASIQQRVKDKAIEVAERTLLKLKDMNPTLANELTPEFKKDPNWGALFSLTLSSDLKIPINKRGSGVRRLILLNFFRAEAERRRQAVNNPSIIYAFEEPETSQHPDHQVVLIQAFKDLTATPDTQVFLTTHTPALGGLIESSSLRLVTTDLTNRVVVEQGTNNVYLKVAKMLGVIPDPLASPVQLLLCVEGPNDVAFLKNISAVVCQQNPALPNLVTEHRIAFVPLGGGTLKDWVNSNYLQQLGIPEFHIYDRDDAVDPPYQSAVNQVVTRGNRHYAVLTTKKEMENYIHPDCIQRSLQVNIGPFQDFHDVPALVAEVIHNASGSQTLWTALDEKNQKSKQSKAKKRLNAIVGTMTVAELQISDQHGEVIGWFQRMQSYLS